ncbi:MAG TPA: hypothetical protein VNH11_09035 [Pirellulales bacterium]|nr:hypothetical protein [Pirellulales bacterium]
MDNLVGRLYPVLFADQHAIRNVMRGMHHRQTDFDTSGLATALMIFCLFFVSVWGVARVFVKSESQSNNNSSQALFRELCRAHRLSWLDWWFLLRLARHHHLSEPALLFLEPQRFDPAACGDRWRSAAPRLRDLQLELFADLASPVGRSTT